ncbi:tyrosine-type recombinase/integrase [Methylobacterium sp. P31]
MATIRKRNGRFQAQVRIKGSGPISKTFDTKAEAQRWARSVEVAIDDGSLSKPIQSQQSTTLGKILTRYQEEITPLKKWNHREKTIIRTVRRTNLWNVRLDDLTEDKAAGYRNIRSRTVKPATVVGELALLAHSLEIARRDWGYPIKSNCFKLVKKPVVRNGRERRLSSSEKQQIFGQEHAERMMYVVKLAEFSVETAVRKGEMLNIRRRDINFERATLLIPEAKNGYARTIPLSPKAMDLLRYGMKRSKSECVFEIEYWTLSRRWEKLRRTLKTHDRKWHDLRHEAISTFFEKGLVVHATRGAAANPALTLTLDHLMGADQRSMTVWIFRLISPGSLPTDRKMRLIFSPSL